MINRIGKLPGSYTVEISLIMPFVLGIILLIIYIGMYIHDKSVMEYAVIKGLVSFENESNIGMELQTVDLVESEINSGCIARWNYETDIHLTDDEVSICVNGQMQHTQGLINMVIDNGMFRISLERTRMRIVR